ncbi:MAG: ATP-dependent sacrificial sulfur transferase LarE [Desulfitobacteriaceae bacterium]
MIVHDKLNALKTRIEELGSLAIGFSGGVDSTFLLKVAYDVLKDKVLAVIAKSSTYPEREFKQAEDFVIKMGIKFVVIVSEELAIEGFSGNPVNRCYYCKKELFSKIMEVARENGIQYMADGTNLDDLSDYRPGMLATKELQVVSPLKDSGFTKDEIRILSKEMDLPTWDKPAFACLASRFPYGQEITAEKLGMVDKAEQYLLDLGFRQVRVRHHGDVARIEVSVNERKKFFDEELMDKVQAELKEIGFTYIALDLEGYRVGSMNETIILV